MVWANPRYITMECNNKQHFPLLGKNKLHFNIQTLFTYHTYTPIGYTTTLQRALASKCLIHSQLRSTTLQCCVTQSQACRLAGICGLPCEMYISIKFPRIFCNNYAQCIHEQRDKAQSALVS